MAWKGWTNGSGDRVSTAAQFSRLTEHAAVTLPTPAGATSFSAGRAPVTPPATTYPTNEAALLAPISAALERLISRGQDHLAVTVRFEQGGSLALKLTMRDGGIAAHMQTDVPGLEDALRTAWTSFAQDWNQRGVKLAAPTFGDASGNADLTAGRDGQRSPHHEAGEFTGEAPSFGSRMGRRSISSASRAGAETAAAPVAGESPRARLARRGLSTWA